MSAKRRNELARRLLAHFYATYEEAGDRSFFISPQESGVLDAVGMKDREYHLAMNHLIDKALLKPVTLGGGCEITVDGVEAWEDRERLDELLPSAATPDDDDASAGPVPLTTDEQAALDFSVEWELANGELTPADELRYEFEGDQGRQLLAALSEKECWDVGGRPVPKIRVTAIGLLSSKFRMDVITLAQRLLGYLHRRQRQERTKFQKYDMKALIEARVAGEGDGPLARLVIETFRLGSGSVESGWSPPHRAIELLDVRNIDGLLRRLVSLDGLAHASAAHDAPPHSLPALTETDLFADIRNFGDWNVHERLGSGGQGIARRATHRSDSRNGVIKVLREKDWPSPEKREKAIKRFRREVSTLLRLKSPFVVKVLDSNIDAEEPWVVLEHVALGSLQQHVGALRGDVWRVLRLARDAAAGLRALHQQKLVHRDVKPGNILLRDMQHAVIADMGIVHDPDATELTSIEEQVGARWFMPPEAQHGRLDDPEPSFDVYSLGKVIYMTLSGGERFAYEEFRKEAHDLVRLLCRRELEAVNMVLDRMIVREPSVRYQSMDEVVSALDRLTAELFGRGLPNRCQSCGEADYEFEDGLGIAGMSIVVGSASNGPGLATRICPVCGDVRIMVKERALSWMAAMCEREGAK